MLDSSRRFSIRSGSFSQRAYGALLLVFGLIAIITPFSAGGWGISILGLIVLVAGALGIIKASERNRRLRHGQPISRAC